MTVMSEGSLLNSKYIKMRREEGGFRAFLTQPPLVIVCHAVSKLSIYGFATVRRAKGLVALDFSR